jgi:hypothetical protein
LRGERRDVTVGLSHDDLLVGRYGQCGDGASNPVAACIISSRR